MARPRKASHYNVIIGSFTRCNSDAELQGYLAEIAKSSQKFTVLEGGEPVEAKPRSGFDLVRGEPKSAPKRRKTRTPKAETKPNGNEPKIKVTLADEDAPPVRE